MVRPLERLAEPPISYRVSLLRHFQNRCGEGVVFVDVEGLREIGDLHFEHQRLPPLPRRFPESHGVVDKSQRAAGGLFF